MSISTSVILSEVELVELTAYTQPARQLRELHRQGFSRARIGRTGAVILERAHYESVAAGRIAVEAPRVRPPKLRMPA